MGGYKISESRKPTSDLGVTVDDEDNEVWVLDPGSMPDQKEVGFRQGFLSFWALGRTSLK